MIDVFDLWERFKGVANTQQGGHARPERNFIQWVNTISAELFEEKFADYGKSQQIADTLAQPFLVSVNVALDGSGREPYDLMKLPEDYGHFSSARILIGDDGKGCACSELPTIDGATGKCKVIPGHIDDPDEQKAAEIQANASRVEVAINKIDNSRWGAVFQHPRRKPTVTNPYLTQFEKGFKVAPKGVGMIVLDYLRKPKTATFAYTLDANENMIYNKAGSVPVDWTDLMVDEFLKRLLVRYGTYTQQPFLIQASAPTTK